MPSAGFEPIIPAIERQPTHALDRRDRRTRNFMAVFTTAYHWSLSWARYFHSHPPTIFKINFNITQPFKPRCYNRNNLFGNFRLSIFRAIELLLVVLNTVRSFAWVYPWDLYLQFSHARHTPRPFTHKEQNYNLLYLNLYSFRYLLEGRKICSWNRLMLFKYV